MTIEEINIRTKDDAGDIFVGLRNDKYNYKGLQAEAVNKTTNSIELFIYTKKKGGVNSYQWVTFDDFRKTFLQ